MIDKIIPAAPSDSNDLPKLRPLSSSTENSETSPSFSSALNQAMLKAPALTVTPKGTHPSHHSPDSSGAGKQRFQEKSLDVRAYRQELIASNIANADTPGYKAVDIEIKEALQQSSASLLRLTTTSASHAPEQSLNSKPPFPLKYHVPTQSSVDDNTVEMDFERAKFSENSLMYQFSLERAGSHYKKMIDLFNNLK